MPSESAVPPVRPQQGPSSAVLGDLPGHGALAPAQFAPAAARSGSTDWRQDAAGCSGWQSPARVLQLDCDARQSQGELQCPAPCSMPRDGHQQLPVKLLRAFLSLGR